VGSLEHRVLSKARQMAELGVVDRQASLAAIRPISDISPRPLGADEFAEQARPSGHTQAQRVPLPQARSG
jgi:hypothetical protein